MHTVIVNKVGDSDAEQGALETCIQPGKTFALQDPLHSLDGVGVGFLRLNLSSGGECDQGVSAFVSACLLVFQTFVGGQYVKAIESNPPPAPASACATLSLCCAAIACAAGDVKDAFCAWACGREAAGSGLVGVGAATLSDMFVVLGWSGLAGMDVRGEEYGVLQVMTIIYRAKERNGRLQWPL